MINGEKIMNFVKDDKGSPLIEEGMLIGLAVIALSIIISLILQAMGWSTDALKAIFDQLDQIKNNILALFGLS